MVFQTGIGVRSRKGKSEVVGAGFIDPMLCLAVDQLPEGPAWQYEVKLDGYRAIGVHAKNGIELWSRNRKDFSRRFRQVHRALEALPEDTVVDGEIVAVDGDGRPSFNHLQNFARASGEVVFYVFDAPVLGGENLCRAPLEERREKLRVMAAELRGPIRYSETFHVSASELMEVVRANELEGVVAKRRDSSYIPGDRSGAWVKVRANRAQDFLIGGYTPGSSTFDSILVGYYEGRDLMYAGRIRSGFTPASRHTLVTKFAKLLMAECPFRNLPEKSKGRWGEGLTADDMKKCRWLRPKLVATIEFLEWTPENRLRHPKFLSLRDDKVASEIAREQ